MSNPYDPNAPGSPQSPNAQWGVPPTQAGYQPPPPPGGAWNGGQGPYAAPPASSGGGGSKWVIGCLVVLLIAVACCGGTLFVGWRTMKSTASNVVQQQAAAMGAGSYLEVCRHNSPSLQATTPCDQYVAWLNAYAPWFAGATISGEGIEFNTDPTYGMRYTLHVSGTGPRGSGRLTFAVVTIGGQSYVQAIVPNQ